TLAALIECRSRRHKAHLETTSAAAELKQRTRGSIDRRPRSPSGGCTRSEQLTLQRTRSQVQTGSPVRRSGRRPELHPQPRAFFLARAQRTTVRRLSAFPRISFQTSTRPALRPAIHRCTFSKRIGPQVSQLLSSWGGRCGRPILWRALPILI